MKIIPNWLVKRVAARLNAADQTIVKSFTQRDASAYTDSLSGSEAGVLVSAQAAMQLDAVWACVRLIAETIASLPFSLYIRGSTGDRVAEGHNLQFLIHDLPNSKSTATVFWEAVVSAMLLQGNAYVEVRRAGGKIASLLFLAPSRLQVTKDLMGNKLFYYTNDNGTQRQVASSSVWQLQGYTLDGVDGVSAIAYGAKVFGTAIAAERQAARTFVNGMMQSVYYKIQAFLTEDQRAMFKENVQGSVERGEVPLLEGGTDVQSLGINPSDAQLLESRSYGVEAICRWFRVPPSMVGHSGNTTAWGTGIEQQMIAFLTFTLAPWLRRIEQAVTLGLLSDYERLRYYAKFNVDDLLRSDSAARAAFYTAMLAAGAITRDEVRAREGLPLLGDKAAVLTVNSATVPLNGITNAKTTSTVSSGNPTGTVDAATTQLQSALSHLKSYLEGGTTQ